MVKSEFPFDPEDAYRQPILGAVYLGSEERKEFRKDLYEAAPNSPARTFSFFDENIRRLGIEQNRFIEMYDLLESDLDKWQQAIGKNKKKGVVQSALTIIDSEPHNFPAYLEALDVISKLSSPSAKAVVDDNYDNKVTIRQSDTVLKQSADSYRQAWDIDNFRKNLEGFNPISSPGSLGAWMALGAKSQEHKPYVEAILERHLKNCDSTEKVVDFLYNLSLGTFATKDKEVVKYGLQFLYAQTPVFKEDSKKFELFHLGIATQKTTTFDKYNQILMLIRQIGIVDIGREIPNPTGRYVRDLVKREGKLLASEVEGGRTARERWDAESYNLTNTTKGNGGTASQYKSPEGPLAEITNDLHAFLLNKSVIRLGSDNFVLIDIPPTPIEIILAKKMLLESSAEGINNVIADRKGACSLFAYGTPVDLKTNEELAKDLVVLREELFKERTRGISQRGDAVKIVDPTLKDLGYRKLTFKHGDKAENLNLTIEVGSFEYHIIIDSEYKLRDQETKEIISLPQGYGAWLEHAILSHLYYVQCRPVSEKGKDIATSADDENKVIIEPVEAEENNNDPYIERVGHLRQQGPRNGFRDSAAKNAINERNGMNLEAINAALGNTFETGMMTYVHDKYGDNIDPTKLPPHQLSFTHAMDRVKKIMTPS